MRDNDAPLLLDVSRLVWRRWTGTRQTGIDRICLAWLEHYAPQAQGVVIHRHGKAILSQRASQALFRALLKPDSGEGDVARFRRDIIGLGLRHGAQLRDRFAGRGRLWLNPGHTGLDARGLADWCRLREVRPVYLVHDLIPITHPDFCRGGEEQRHRRRIQTVLSTAVGVVANSTHTLQTLSGFASQEGASLPPAVTIWPGTPRLLDSPAAANERPNFVVLGTIEARKNHSLLLSVWQDLIADSALAEHPTNIPQLIIVGRRGWRADGIFEILDKHDFAGCVREVGPLSDRQLAEVLRGTRAVLFPSLAEGFGMPLVEALAAGVPVIASDLPVFREIGQGVPDLVQANDRDAWMAAIKDYSASSSDRRAAQLKRMRKFRAYSWSHHFAKLDDFLRTL